ncbi:MAG TPA: tetratricopeptide repeat protein [Ktedonobacteraceae bacterium]|jgi:tetratricopeptide (TPR) repeat protein|nr:tetratricopeptide repeat protein [Ktedonobacteraceae bacterium]
MNAPHERSILKQQAQEHLQARHWLQAEEDFKQLLAIDAQDEEALLGRAAALDGLGQFDALYEIAEHIVAIDPSSAAALAFKARALQKLERLSAATIANDQALLLDTNLGLAWINRCGLQLLQQKYPEALRSALRATELAPDDARAWANKGMALYNNNALFESLEAFNTCLKKESDFLLALQMRGEIFLRLGRLEAVFNNARQMLTLYPHDLTALTQALQATRGLEYFEELSELSQAMLQTVPDSLFAWEHLMRGLRALGKFDDALDALNHLLALDALNVRNWTFKADTLYRLARYREAVNAGSQALQLDPEFPPAIRIHEKALRLMYQRKERKPKQKE